MSKICKHCGNNIDDVVFGMTKVQVKKLYEDTAGVRGRTWRNKANQPGYMLFAQELEKVSKKNVVKNRCTNEG
jgi:hypothetical protein